MKLTPNRIDVLTSLFAAEVSKYGGSMVDLPDGRRVRMFAPIDFGGSNDSHHSHTATALGKYGLVDRYKYSTGHLNNFNSRVKGACVYALTDAGRKLVSML